MTYIDLLGMPLKSDFLCDLFETYDVQVVYEYDRTHENLADEYRAEIPDLGLQFVFDESQTFKTLFKEQVEINTFNPFDGEGEEFKLFESKGDAKLFAVENGIQISEGSAELFGEERDWVRFEYSSYTIHYEYVGSKLRMITLQVKSA